MIENNHVIYLDNEIDTVIRGKITVFGCFVKTGAQCGLNKGIECKVGSRKCNRCPYYKFQEWDSYSEHVYVFCSRAAKHSEGSEHLLRCHAINVLNGYPFVVF